MSTHYLVLTASAGVSDEAVAIARAALGDLGIDAGPAVLLAESAVEMPCEGGLPDGFEAGIPGVDVNAVAAAGRRKALLMADMDSTMIGVECIDELADFAGVKPAVAAITEETMRGERDFESSLVARVALMRGLSVSALETCHAERVRLNPGARCLVQTMAALGAATALVSGGFTFFTERVAAEAGFGAHFANRLEFENGALTGDVARPILGREAKLAILRDLCAAEGIGPQDILAVGDGANDGAMVTEAGLGVAYHAKPALEAVADVRLRYSDLTALLALQGIPQSEWRR